MRVRWTLTSCDLLIAAALAADGLWIAPVHPLWGVITVGLGVGVALAHPSDGAGHGGRDVPAMIAIEIAKPGGPDVLVPVERPKPSPGRARCSSRWPRPA